MSVAPRHTPRTGRRRAGARPRPGGGLDATTAVMILAFAAVAWLGLKASFFFNYNQEAQPSVTALLGGHIGAFLRLAPAYGPSLLLRSPFMAFTQLWGGGAIAVYRAGALPCLAAAAGLAVWLNAQMRGRGCGLAARLVAVAVCVAEPLGITALIQGHPEEILGAVLCVAAVLCAQRERPIWSGILVGLAIANKDWGLLAAGPALVALPRGRFRAIAAMVVTAGLLFAPFVLVAHSSLTAQTQGLALHSDTIFQPLQLWWFVAPQGFSATGGPAWLAPVGHTLPIAIMVPLSLAFAARLRRRPERRRQDAMLLLALLLLLRCALDPWDVLYYPVPFLIALLTWEATVFNRVPRISLVTAIVVWLLFQEAQNSLGISLNTLAALFATLTVAAIGAIGVRLLRNDPRTPDP